MLRFSPHYTIHLYWGAHTSRHILPPVRPGRRVFLFRSVTDVLTFLTQHFHNSIFTHFGMLATRYVHNSKLVSHNLGLAQIYASETFLLIDYFATSQVASEFGAFGDQLPGPSLSYSTMRCTRRGAAGWRHCSTTRKVEGSLLDCVIEIFHWHNPSGRIMALGSTQPLKEMRTRNISWGVKEAGARVWQTYYLHAPDVMKSGSFCLLDP